MGGKILKIIFIIFVLFFAYKVFGYDNLRVHPLLSEAATGIYNQQAGNKLTDQQSSWIIRGSIDEDNDPRYLNHYYNPLTGKGLDALDQIGKLKLKVQGGSAKKWAKSQSSSTGDYSESAILKNYQDGNLMRAYQGVGHILHLVQDMAVPAHTRNDSHAMGDPYEKWAEQYAVINPNKLSFLNVNNLDQAFDSMAGYSNNNFFSRDTIDSSVFNNYEIITENNNNLKVNYLVNNINGSNYRLCKLDNSSIKPICKINEEDFKVHLDYWNLLYPKAVGYSAGVIDYFVKQFEQIDKVKKEQEQVSWWQKLKNNLASLKSEAGYAWGDVYMTQRNALVSGYDNLAALITNTQNDFQNFSEANKEIIEQAANEVVSQTEQVGRVLSAFEQAGGAEEIFKPQPARAESAPENNQIPPSASQASPPAKQGEPARAESASENSQIPLTPFIKGGEIPLIQNIRGDEIQISPTPNVQAGNTAPTFIFIAGDSLPPETSITSAPGQITNSSSTAFIFTSSESNSNFECNLNDADWQTCSSPRNFSNLADGNYIFKVRARDSSNNVDQTPAEHNWTIDTTAPRISITSGPSKIASSTVANFQFASSESETAFTCQLDADSWQLCSASTTADNLIEGNHSLEVKGADLAGNVSTSTAITWLVDLTAPTSTAASLEAVYEATGFTVSWSGSDADATGATTTASGLADFDAQYKIDAGSWQDWINATTSTSTTFNLAVASGQIIYFHVRATDAAGNLSAWSNEPQTQISSNLADYVVISEVSAGGTASEDFIELYNPTASAISLSGYSIQYRGGGAHDFEKKNFLTSSTVKSKAYFLIAPNAYTGSVGADFNVGFDLSAAGGTVFLVNGTVKLTDGTATSTEVVDRLAYGSGDHLFPEGTVYFPAPAAGQSLERKAAATSTAITMAAGGTHERSGNGYDSNNNSADFVLKNSSIPQAASNSLEPRPEISAGLKHLWHFDECEGSSLNDSAGVDNLPQNATRVVGKWQCAISQSWQVQYDIEKTFSAPLPAGELTYSFYLRSSDWVNAARNHFYLKNAGGQIMAGVRSGMYTKFLYFNDLSTTTIPAMPDNSDWHMITAVHSQNSLVYYVDGVRQAFYPGDYRINSPITDLEMKGENWSVDTEEMAIWSRALGTEEVQAIYSANVPLEPYTPPASPLAAERLHWWHFNEGAGTTAADSAGSMNLSPIVVWTGGKNGGGIEHTWRNGYEINQAITPEINSKDLSIDFWWQNSAYPNEGRVSLELQNSAGVKIFGIRPSIYSGLYYFDGGEAAISAFIPQDSNWHHLALVYNSYDFYLYFYVDGVEKIKTPKIWFGRPITKLVIRGENWSYKLDELAIWRGALTASQVLNIYRGE